MGFQPVQEFIKIIKIVRIQAFGGQFSLQSLRMEQQVKAETVFILGRYHLIQTGKWQHQYTEDIIFIFYLGL